MKKIISVLFLLFCKKLCRVIVIPIPSIRKCFEKIEQIRCKCQNGEENNKYKQNAKKKYKKYICEDDNKPSRFPNCGEEFL